MTAEFKPNDILQKSFLTTMLLTGSAEQAELAILNGIEALGEHDGCEKGIFLNSVAAAIAWNRSNPGRIPSETERAIATLPSGLRSVLGLPLFLRQCFVLRVLAGMPKAACAASLEIEESQIDEMTAVAAQALADSAPSTESRVVTFAWIPPSMTGTGIGDAGHAVQLVGTGG